MTDRDILIKALEKCKMSGVLGYARMVTELMEDLTPDYYYHFIFTKWFAKAFWGKENIRVNEIQEQQPKHYIRFDLIPAWQHHLQQMVLEEEPLRYLEKFL